MQFWDALVNVLAIIAIIGVGAFVMVFVGDLLLNVIDNRNGIFFKHKKTADKPLLSEDEFTNKYIANQPTYLIEDTKESILDESARIQRDNEEKALREEENLTSKLNDFKAIKQTEPVVEEKEYNIKQIIDTVDDIAEDVLDEERRNPSVRPSRNGKTIDDYSKELDEFINNSSFEDEKDEEEIVEPAVEETVAEEVAEPVAQPAEAIVAEPVVEETVVTEPVIAEPVVAEPAVEQPMVTESEVVEPEVAEPTAEEPADEEPKDEGNLIEKPDEIENAEELKAEYEKILAETAQAKEELEKIKAEIESAKATPAPVVNQFATEEEYEERIALLEERLKEAKKDFKQNAKEYKPLEKVRKTLEKDKAKLRRREAIVAKKKVELYGVNNFVDIDQEKAEKLSNELELLDGLRLSVSHCEEVMEANKERFPILEKTNMILRKNIENIESDLAKVKEDYENFKSKK